MDTVFLVSTDITKYNFNNIKDIFKQRDQYYHASVNPLYNGIKCNDKVDKEDSCRIEPDKDYALYKGVNYDEKDNYEGIYSFVPCKKYYANKESDYIFKQPIIDLDFISGSQTQGINACNDRNFTKEEIVNYWIAISEQIENFGSLKGVNFKTPE